MTLDSKTLRGLFEHKRSKPTNIRTSQGNVQKFSTIKANYEYMFKISLVCNSQLSYHSKSPKYLILTMAFSTPNDRKSAED